MELVFTSELKKLSLVVLVLLDIAIQFLDLIINLQSESPFGRLKRIILRTSLSVQKKLTQLLSAEVMGSKKP